MPITDLRISSKWMFLLALLRFSKGQGCMVFLKKRLSRSIVRSLDSLLRLRCKLARESCKLHFYKNCIVHQRFPAHIPIVLRREGRPPSQKNLQNTMKQLIDNTNAHIADFRQSASHLKPVLDQLNIVCRAKYFKMSQSILKKTKLQCSERLFKSFQSDNATRRRLASGIRNQLIKTKVERFLEKQLLGATTESVLEASKMELKQKEEEIAVLQAQLTSKNPKDIQVQSDSKNLENIAVQTISDDLDPTLLKNEIQRLQKENFNLITEISKAQTQCAELERGLESCRIESSSSMVKATNDCELDPGVKQPGCEELQSKIQLLEQRLGESESGRNTERAEYANELEAVKSSLLEANLRAEKADSNAQRMVSEMQIELKGKSDEIAKQLRTISSLRNELEQLQQKHQTVLDQLAQSHTSFQSLEVQMTELKLKHQSELETQVAEVQRLSALVSSLQEDRERLRSQCDELTSQLRQHECTIKAAESRLTESRIQLELELEEARSQLAVSKKEADSLMERLIKSEDQVTTLKEELSTQVNEVECLNKAIFELGRENQSLQIMRERVTSRQWTKDDDAPACAICNREFSLSNRRHHCRNCGGVFCHPCSSNRASTAASKDPVRVCNPCYLELTR